MKTFYEQTIIDAIDFEGYGDDAEKFEDYPLYNKIQKVYSIFREEYVHDNNMHTNQGILFKEWLQGLPSILTVPFMNYIILANAKDADFDLDTETKEDLFLDSYWMRLTYAFFTLKENL